MQIPSEQPTSEWLYNYALWTLRSMSFNTPSILDCPIASGAVRDRVRELCDANLRSGTRDAAARISAYSSVLETIAKEYPLEDPVLLCWRVWLEDGKAPLASSDVSKRKPMDRKSNSYRCMASGLYTNIANALEHERDRLLSEIHVEGRALTSADVEESRLRVAAAIRSWRLRRQAIPRSIATAIRKHRRPSVSS